MSPIARWIGSESNTKLHHAVALGILSLAILIRWHAYLLSAEPMGDENIYLRAFQAVAEGTDPREVGGFYYPETFSAVGGWLLETLGKIETQVVLRVSSVLGLALTVWLSACLFPARWSHRLALSTLYVCTAPAVYYGISIGNISLAINGAILLALATWSTRPIASGLLLGASSAIKPLAPLAIAALFFHRPVPETRSQLKAGAVAGALALAFLMMNPKYLSTPAEAIGRLPFIRSISLNRILVLLGLETSPLIITVVLGTIVVLVVRLFPMNRQTILSFGGCAAAMAVPIIWSHTLLLTLPIQTLALARAVSRRREARETAMPSTGANRDLVRSYELMFVLLAIASLQFTEGLGAVDDQVLWFQLTVLVGAYLAAPILIAYVITTDPKVS